MPYVRALPGHLEPGYLFPAMPARFSLVFCSTTVARPGEGIVRTAWDCWTFEYVLSGKGSTDVGGEHHDVVSGDLFLLPKGLPHRYQADTEQPWTTLYAVLDGALVASLLDAHGLSGLSLFRACGCHSEMEAMQEIWSARADDMHDQAVIVLHRLLQKLARCISSRDVALSVPVRTAASFIRRNIERPISIEEIAAVAGRSRAHLTRQFKKETGFAPYEYLIRQRLATAQQLLRLTSLRVNEIADRLCYADAFCFSNAFKQYTGLSPSAYRSMEAGCGTAERV